MHTIREYLIYILGFVFGILTSYFNWKYIEHHDPANSNTVRNYDDNVRNHDMENPNDDDAEGKR